MTRTITTEIDYDNPWTFNDIPFTSQDIKSYVGFVYLITEIDTNKKYIGRKYFINLEKRKVNLNELNQNLIGKNIMARQKNFWNKSK